MKNFKLLNDTFIHLTNGNKGYTTHGKESKYIKWIHEGEEIWNHLRVLLVSSTTY